MKLEFLELGKIGSPHGLKGELAAELFCDGPAFLKAFKRLYAGEADGAGKKEYGLSGFRLHGKKVLLSLKGVENRDEAELLRGKTLFVRRDEAPLEKGRFFIAELIGCSVRDLDDVQKEYGTLSEITNCGASDIWHIEKEGRSFLMPAIPDIKREVDIEKGVIRIRPLPGIFDDAGDEVEAEAVAEAEALVGVGDEAEAEAEAACGESPKGKGKGKGRLR